MLLSSSDYAASFGYLFRSLSFLWEALRGRKRGARQAPCRDLFSVSQTLRAEVEAVKQSSNPPGGGKGNGKGFTQSAIAIEEATRLGLAAFREENAEAACQVVCSGCTDPVFKKFWNWVTVLQAPIFKNNLGLAR